MAAAERLGGGGRAAARGWTGAQVAVALLLMVSLGTFRRREIWEFFTDTGVDAEVKFKLAIWLALAGVALLAWRRVLANGHLLLAPPLVFYAGFALLALVSTLYSGTPDVTLFRAGQLMVLLALGVAAADRIERWPRLAVLFLALNWAILLVGLTGHPASLDWRLLPGFQEAEFVTDETATWRFGTPMGHFSQIGIVAALAAVAVAARLRRAPDLSELCLLAWLVLTILLTVSRTAIAGLAGALVVILALRGLLAFSALAATAAVSVLLALPGAGATVAGFLGRGQTQEDLMSLTNRTTIYDSAWRTLGDHWLLGQGFRSRTVVLDQQLDGSGVSHAHNAILEAAVGLGVGGAVAAALVLLGLVACAAGLLLGRRWAGRPEIRERGVEFAALCPPILACSFLDSSFALEVSPFTLCFVAILVDLARCRSPVPAAATAGTAAARPATTPLESAAP